MPHYAEVVPLLRLPKSMGFFDYEINAELLPIIAVGQIVKIPWRQQKIYGLIIRLKDTTEAQKIKKVEKIIDYFPQLSGDYLNLMGWFKDYYGISWAHTVKTMLPQIKKAREVKKIASNNYNPPLKSAAKVDEELLSLNDKQVFWRNNLSIKGRIEVYSALLKNCLKNNRQAILLMPEFSRLELFAEKLKPELGEDLAVLNSQAAAGQQTGLWHKFATGEIKIIIGTRIAAFLPFDNLGLLILDNCQNDGFRQWDLNPRYDTKELVQKIAELKKIKVIYSDIELTINDQFKIEQKKMFLLDTNPNYPEKKVELVDMQQEFAKKNYSIFSEALQSALAQIERTNGQGILYINKRGTAGLVICRDCGQIVKCQKCGWQLTKYQANPGEPDLICHHCQARSFFSAFCSKCHGTNFKFGGAGTQKVELELKKLFPKLKIWRLDSDANQESLEKESKEIKSWQDGKYNILIGTQKIIGLPLDPSQLVGIINIESTLNLPDYTAAEQAFYKIAYLNSLTSQQFILQSYNANNPVLTEAVQGDWPAFYAREIGLRRDFNYPPFVQYWTLYSGQITDERTAQLKAENLYQSLKNNSDLQVYPPEQILYHFKRYRINFKKNLETALPPQLIPDDWIIDIR